MNELRTIQRPLAREGLNVIPVITALSARALTKAEEPERVVGWPSGVTAVSLVTYSESGPRDRIRQDGTPSSALDVMLFSGLSSSGRARLCFSRFAATSLVVAAA